MVTTGWPFFITLSKKFIVSIILVVWFNPFIFAANDMYETIASIGNFDRVGNCEARR